MNPAFYFVSCIFVFTAGLILGSRIERKVTKRIIKDCEISVNNYKELVSIWKQMFDELKKETGKGR